MFLCFALYIILNFHFYDLFLFIHVLYVILLYFFIHIYIDELAYIVYTLYIFYLGSPFICFIFNIQYPDLIAHPLLVTLYLALINFILPRIPPFPHVRFPFASINIVRLHICFLVNF